MNNQIEIINTSLTRFPLIIVCKTYLGLGIMLPFIIDELVKRNFNGNVLIDLLLANGYRAKNRFVVSYFDGLSFQEFHIVKISENRSEIVNSLGNYYLTNEEVLHYGILNENDIKTIISNRRIIYSSNDEKSKKNKAHSTSQASCA